MPVDAALREELLKAVEKQYKNKVRTGDSYDNPRRIRFESPTLNYATGGGVPMGRWTRFYGGYSSGKTRTVYGIVRRAQEMGLGVVYYNLEKQYHKGHVSAIGVNVHDLHVVNSSVIEDVGEICETLLPAFHVHVFDSCSAGQSRDALGDNAAVGEWQRGLKVRAWNKVFDRLREAFDDNENTIIQVDQVRINQKHNNEEPPGGKAMEHESSLTLSFKRGSWLYYDTDGYLKDTGENKSPITGKPEPDGIDIDVRVMKSRVGRPLRTANMRLDLATRMFDTDWELAKYAVGSGFVQKNGSWLTLPEGYETPEGKTKVQGLPQLTDLVRSNADLREEWTDALLDEID